MYQFIKKIPRLISSIRHAPHWVAAGLLLGASVFSFQADLPAIESLVILLPLLAIAWRWLSPVAWIVLGFLLAWAHALQKPMPDWQADWVGKDIDVIGQVVSLPSGDAQRQRFSFRIEQSTGLINATVQLSWYDSVKPTVRPGERWRLRIRMRPPSGMRNPGGFDYEGYLFRRDIAATGYVRPQGLSEKVAEPRWHDVPVSRLRWMIRDRILTVLQDHPQLPLILALTIGDRSYINAEQWEWLRASGLAHLVAISGLHIGLVSALVFLSFGGVWRRLAWLCRRWPVVPVAAFAGLMAGLFYALLAGLTLPTLRAWLMLAIAAVAILLHREAKPLHVVSLALIVVLILDPLAVSDPGLWLSFGAVALILWVAVGRGRLRGRLLPVQWTLAIGLLPISLAWFGRVSLVAPVANLAAVPLVGTVVVPLALLGVLGLLTGIDSTGLILQVAAWSMGWVSAAAQGLLSVPGMQHWPGEPPFWTVILAVFSALWMLLPSGWPVRWLGIIGFAPLLLVRPDAPEMGKVDVTLMDVGQGLATVIRTRNHVLVYDTGPAFRSGNDTGALVLVPYLRALGVSEIDGLVVSHADLDHRGGEPSLRAAFAVKKTLRGANQNLAIGEQACSAGQSWRWDNVQFTVLWPPQGSVQTGNDGSCVIRIDARNLSVLMTGDIEAASERALIRSGQILQSDLLIAAHHGSNSSTTAEFLDEVDPDRVWFAAGFTNRWGFPRSQVVQRVERRGIHWASTGQSGALRMGADFDASEEHHERIAVRRYWQRSPLISAP